MAARLPVRSASAFGIEPVAVETERGRREYVRQQEELMHRSQPLRRRLLEAYDAFLAEAFGERLLVEAAASPGNERFATATPGGQPWRRSLIPQPTDV